MMLSILFAYLHYIAIFVLVACAAVEHLLYKQDIDVKTAKKLGNVDMIYGMSAGLVLLSGLLRVFFFEKGSAYYLQNPYFYIKVGLFVIIALLSLPPTFHIISWRESLQEGKAPAISAEKAKQVIMLIRMQLTLALLMPLLAILMARGV